MPETPNNTVAIITALALEMPPIARQLRLVKTADGYAGKTDDLNIVAAVSGMGAARVVRTFERVVEKHQPAMVLLAGFAGGLDPFYQVGYVVSGAKVCNEHGETIELDDDGATLLSVDQPVTTPQAKRVLRDKHGAAAVDMESFALAKAAKDRGVAVRIVRTITDAANEVMPAWAATLVREDGSADTGAAVAMLLGHPGRLGAMLALRRGSKVAGDALGAAAAGKIATWFATMMHDEPR